MVRSGIAATIIKAPEGAGTERLIVITAIRHPPPDAAKKKEKSVGMQTVATLLATV